MENSLMSLEDLAKYIGMSKATICRYLKKGKLPEIQIGRLWKFRKEKIDKRLAVQEIENSR